MRPCVARVATCVWWSVFSRGGSVLPCEGLGGGCAGDRMRAGARRGAMLGSGSCAALAEEIRLGRLGMHGRRVWSDCGL